jgi:cyclohexanone monooxygenase
MNLPGHVQHLVIGAGFAGLCAAIRLQEDGETDFLVVEKGSDVGGTWRDNTYPGAACDVPSQLYSFSFAPNPEWSSSFSPQPEIQAYIRTVAERSGVLDRFVFDTAVESADWDESAGHWVVRTTAGTVTARDLIVGAGGLSEPKLPDIEGIGTFQGETFHSARWDHSVDLAGKRVAVIGTGASAIQIVPELQKVVGHLDVYQRTAPYVIPRNDREYTKVERALFKRVPALQKVYRTAIYWGKELLVPGFTVNPKLALPAKKLALANINKGIKDPELRARVTPDFEIGCKRILISNTYYPALASDNVDLVTDPIAKVTGTAVVTADGVEREVDAIVVATGYVRDALRTMRQRRIAAVEPKASAQTAWNTDLQRRMKRTVWTRGGCSSWYLDAHGRNTTLWPTFTFTFRRQLSRCDLGEYVTTARHAPTLELTA